jgi:hypothetical protein
MSNCLCCNKRVDFNKSLDIKNKEHLKKVEFIFEDPEVILKKALEVIKVSFLIKYHILNSFRNFTKKNILHTWSIKLRNF